MATGKTRNFFVWIILGLLFFGLIGFGATGLSATVRTIGSVGDMPVTTQQYYQELQTRIRIRSAQAGRTLSFPEAEEAGLPLQALQTVVTQRGIDNEAAQLGLSVGDDIVSQQVLANPAFRGIDGAFDRATYREALARSGMSVREFETSLREDATRSLLQAAVFTGIPTPDAFGATLAGFTREGRTFTWAPLTAEGIEITLAEPSEADLQAFYDANPDRFTSPETRVIDYVWLTPDMIQDDMPVSEDELRAEYDARIEEFQQPERRLVERLVFPDDAAASEALAAINDGATDFPALVEERGLSLSDIDLGDLTEEQLGDAGADVFAAETGDVVGPFATDLGPALFRMNAVLAARNITFEEALPDLREDQSAARARRFIDDQIDGVENLLAGGAALTDLAEQTDMQLGALDWTADTAEGIAAYAAFRDVAAAQDVGDYPELAQLDDGGLFALQVTEVRAPALIPLDEVRAQVIEGWDAQQVQQAVIAAAEAKQAQLSEAQDFAGLGLGLEAVQENNMTRRGFINGTPPTFVTTVFEMEPGEVRVLDNGTGAIIVRLDAISGADASDEAFVAEQASIAESAAEGIAQDIYELYARTVQQRTDVQLNDAAINAVHANFR